MFQKNVEEEYTKMNKGSIRKQFSLVFIITMAATIILCIIMNDTWLGRYYLSNKQEVLHQAYSRINEVSNEGSDDTDEFQIEIQRICRTYNISILILDADSKTVITSENESKMLTRELLDLLFGAAGQNQENMPERVLLSETDAYQVLRNFDSRAQMNFLEMWGILDNGNTFLIRTALEGIQDSVKISNRFLGYVGILTIIVSAIIIWMITRKITSPILQLADISHKMTNLDFEARYTGQDNNEIGILGNHMNQLSETLEGTISELKSANNELKKDIEKKEKIDEMRREFLSNVSHELKTPLALIMGYAEGLKMGIQEDQESRDFYCEVIMDEATKMDTMVKKLLTLNQIEFGNDRVTMERFDIVELIRNYLQSAGILIESHTAKVQFGYEEPLYVWGDSFMVEEVFMNYFSNALNHLGGERVIKIVLQKMDNLVRVSVENTGMPIPEESMPHLWEKFYKVDKARTREYGGSGIGLSIVKAMMESMNQKYGVSNTETGVQFWFELECK